MLFYGYEAWVCQEKHKSKVNAVGMRYLRNVRGMNGLKKGWFSELSSLWPGISQSLEVSEVLHSEKSDFQDILVLQT
uniref:PABS domain-containing protein n=1 Tax=Timema poppense TaxID=170557 RepID=A0A7R9DB82_TIMPO|nr:unnamed protein product [Timema poppensis]